MAESKKNEKYAYLDRLSTEQLEELLRADIGSPEDGDEGVIFHILEVIERREEECPTGRLPEEEKAWSDFQRYYNIPEGEGVSLYPCGRTDGEVGQAPVPSPGVSTRTARPVRRLRSALKLAGIVAAVIVGLFALMIGAQAAGIDVFGAIGRWTEETFRFVPASGGAEQGGGGGVSAPETAGYHDALQAALEECGLSGDLAPTWYPEGYTATEPEILRNSTGDTVHVAFYGDEERFFVVDVTHYGSASDLEALILEKDGMPIELYTSDTKTFYIMSNMDTVTATWSDGLLVVSISGTLSTDEIKSIIDSIGG